MLLARSDDLTQFANMGPTSALPALLATLTDGTLFTNLAASLGRIMAGLTIASILGIGIGILIGLRGNWRSFTHVPFQLLRMISPLAWMPVAVIAFDTWNGAIIFIIVAAAIWPIVFAVAGAIRRLNPEWDELAANLGAKRQEYLRDFILPAVAQDLLAGMRLALGVAWIVIVPGELLGVTSGLGYAINDARDALEYDRLAAMVLAIGIVGLLLDSCMHFLVRRWAWQPIS